MDVACPDVITHKKRRQEKDEKIHGYKMIKSSQNE
jgi:hypothetical protein